MLLASIDIGSNAARLLIANASLADGRSHVDKVELIRVPIRLGEEVFNSGVIPRQKVNELINTMKAFKLLIDLYKPEKFVACATAAMREASNGAAVVKKVKKETGIRIKIIDGLKEAEIIRSSNPYELPLRNRLTMYVDVGGGSTEISVVDREKLVDLKSFQIGTVRMLNNHVVNSEWQHMTDWLNQFRDYYGRINLIGSGGNINKIVKLFGRPDDNILILNNLKYGIRHLSQLSIAERIEQMALRPDRADVIVPAAEIYLKVMETVGAESILVPRIGLSDGLIHIMFRNINKIDPKKQVHSTKIVSSDYLSSSPKNSGG